MQEFIETKHKKYNQIAVRYIASVKEIKMKTPTESAVKMHKTTIKNSRLAIRDLRRAKRQAIKEAKQQFKVKRMPHRHTIKMTKLLLKQVKTAAKLQKLNDK